jgi:predicted RNA binding protein YcfA (HicA-like mRNA interferase family)
MAKRSKLLERIRNNPKQVSFHDLRQLLESFGFELDHATGSHYVFVGLVAGLVPVLPFPSKEAHFERFTSKKC